MCNLAITRFATARLAGRRDGAPSDPFVRAALERAGASDAHITLQSDFPVGAGLGGSSAAGVAMAAALAAFQDRRETPSELAEWSRALEVEQMGIAGGRQDHYAAAYGGALGLAFSAHTAVEQIPLSARFAEQLEGHCMLAYTGESRMSGTTITAVLDAYRERVPRVVQALERMRDLAMSMRDAMRRENVAELAVMVDEHWVHQRALHPGITTPRIDAINAAARQAGAIGLKALGASGGGCVLIFVPDDARDRVVHAVGSLATFMPWSVSHVGVQVFDVDS